MRCNFCAPVSLSNNLKSDWLSSPVNVPKMSAIVEGLIHYLPMTPVFSSNHLVERQQTPNKGMAFSRWEVCCNLCSGTNVYFCRKEQSSAQLHPENEQDGCSI
ncbi:hypothetical protein AVEN_28491-1 [Araneus ventricosus]|uniref:Uncharacterized protein n=1 Tax=Araneus ventricosus TaxID=182803 RepID=A0A4Y2MHJ2_ARAVE|nr:hypothetical protein AVEN_28491-1 [Araneus ventricosus]